MVKEKLADDDMIMCFEHDMVIHANHIQHFSAIANEHFHLQETAPNTIAGTL